MQTSKNASSASRQTRTSGRCAGDAPEPVLIPQNKFIALQKQHSSTVSAMQLEMDNLRSERDKTLIAIRDLEMGNDELESMHR